MKEEYSRNPSAKLLKDIQEAKKHIPQLQGQLFRATGATQVKSASTQWFMEKASGDSVPPDFSEFYLVCGIQTKINLNPSKGLGFSRGGVSPLCLCNSLL